MDRKDFPLEGLRSKEIRSFFSRVSIGFILLFTVTCITCNKKRVFEHEKPEGGPTGRIETNVFDMKFIELSPGRFIMGSDSEEATDSEKPLHVVIISKKFELQSTEVTQRQWEAVMGENPSDYTGSDQPVENVSWNDCQEFIRKLNERDPGKIYRLPTEAEWEYACRAGTIQDRYGDINEIAWFGNVGVEPVGQKKPNAWGFFDILGNVGEWCADYYGSYSIERIKDPIGPLTGSYRVYRGGSWAAEAVYIRATVRGAYEPSIRYNFIGLRLARNSSQDVIDNTLNKAK